MIDALIAGLHVWRIREGLRGTEPKALFADFCCRLVAAGVPVWRAFAGLRTLHPQWAGHGYTWWRDGDGVEPQQFPRGDRYEQLIANSIFGYLRRSAAAIAPEGDPWFPYDAGWWGLRPG